jgi:hypothetical protein
MPSLTVFKSSSRSVFLSVVSPKTLSGPEDERVDHQLRFVEAVSIRGLRELRAAVDHDLAIQLLPQLRDLLDDVAVQHRRVPHSILWGRGFQPGGR